MKFDAEVIKAAATSPLGILALMVMALSIIALAFFQKADNRTKIIIFILLLAGVGGFATAIIRSASASALASPGPATTTSTPIASPTAQPPSAPANNTTVTANGNDATAIGTINGNVQIH